MSAEQLRLIAHRLVCVRGERLVFEDLDFAVSQGEALILRGPNGSGKSSLLRQIAGLVALSGGELTLEGADPHRSLSEQAHYLGHQDALKPALSALDMLQFWADFFGTSERTPLAAIEAWGLAAQARLPIAYLSAGQRRRLALARLSFGRRPLWLLDEPSVGLDDASVEVLRQNMEAHLQGGGLLIAATHLDLGLARVKLLQLGDRS